MNPLKHIIKWLLVNPGLHTYAYHLSTHLCNHIDITVFEPDSAFAYACKELLPTATIVQASIINLESFFSNPISPSSTFTMPSTPIHSYNPSLPIAYPSFTINGIDIPLDNPIAFPLPSTLPSDLQCILNIITTLSIHCNLQCFVIPCTLLSTHPTPFSFDCTLIKLYLKHWSITYTILYGPHLGDPLAATQLVICGNHRNRSSLPPVSLPCHQQRSSINTEYCSCLNNHYNFLALLPPVLTVLFIIRPLLPFHHQYLLLPQFFQNCHLHHLFLIHFILPSNHPHLIFILSVSLLPSMKILTSLTLDLLHRLK